jgi:hypothetical protein
MNKDRWSLDRILMRLLTMCDMLDWTRTFGRVLSSEDVDALYKAEALIFGVVTRLQSRIEMARTIRREMRSKVVQ